MAKSDSLLLKWGTVKGWSFESTEGDHFDYLREYLENAPMSCAMDKPDKDRKELLCKFIDHFEGEIQNDWTGEFMTKEEAKNYVMEYGEE